MPIEGPQVDCLRGAAGRATDPKEPMPGFERAADRRREKHRHTFGLPLVPCRDQAAGILQDLSFSRPPGGRFLVGGGRAACFHLAAIESHRRIVAE